jgi:dTDP-glucose 4,6-dehydratase
MILAAKTEKIKITKIKEVCIKMDETQQYPTLLVTGGAGFIGSNFIHYLLRQPPGKRYRVVNLDKLTYAGNLENLKTVENHPDYHFVQGDIGDPDLVERLFQTYHFDYVVNFAAESHVDRSITDPEIFIKTNVLGTANLLNITKKFWLDQMPPGGTATARKFLQVSTDEVYGSLGATGYFTETTPLNPHSPYSASKAGADLLVAAYGDTYGLPVNITRCSNNYGPYQFPEKLIPLLINNAMQLKLLPVYGDGLNVRDWLFVEDHCQAILLVLTQGRLGEVYNIGGHNERTNLQIVKTVLNYLRERHNPAISEALLQYVADRKGHDRRYGIDPRKLATELGWQPETDFETGIRRTIEWYLQNPDWLQRVTSGAYQKYYEAMYQNR